MRSTLVFFALLVSACPASKARPAPDPVAAGRSAARALSSPDACRADVECAAALSCFQGQCVHECSGNAGCQANETCSPRGRCVSGAGAAAEAVSKEADVVLRLTNTPITHYFARGGLASVTLHLELSGAVPAGGLGYRIERSDDPTAGATLLRAQGDHAVDLPLPVGAADPALGANSKVVDLTVYTAVGRFAVRIEPSQPVEGSYAGTLTFSNLGTMQAELQVVTQPAGATLADATARWVVLDVTAAGFLSPQDVASTGGATTLAAPLEFDAFANLYVARFNHAYALDGAASQVFHPAANRVGRGLRIELTQGLNASLTGNAVDVWSGLFEVQGLGGVPAPTTTYQTGTLDLHRTGPAITAAEAMALPAGAAPAVPVAQGAAPLDACSSVLLNAMAPSCHDASASTDDLAAFQAAAAAVRATCANDAVAAALNTGATVTAKLAQYTSSTPPAAGTFTTFLDDCRAGTNGTCVPTPALLCARQLAAHAYQGLDADPARAGVVLQSYLDATREATLGPQLAAFWSDYQARLDWLKTDGAPSVVASALTADSLARLTTWKTSVLDRHLATLSVQLDPSARAVYARIPADQHLADARGNALIALSQTWRGAADALTFMVRRLNTLQQDSAARAASASDAQLKARDLYLVASVVAGLAQANGTLATAPFRGTFGALVHAINDLAMPFQNLVFSRDAEVVVSTSLDPASSTQTILGQRRAAAHAALDTATTLVNGVIDGVIADGLTQLQFSSALAVEVQSAQADIQRLCGLPTGCTVAQLGTTAQCAPRVGLGACGFDVDQAGTVNFQSQINASRAGAQVLEVVKAVNALHIATAARDAQANTVEYSARNVAAFAEGVKQWNQTRGDTLAQMQAIFTAQNGIQDTALKTLIATQAAMAATRQDSIAGDQADIAKWDQLRVGAADKSFDQLVKANNEATASSALQAAAEVTEFVTQGFAEPLTLTAYLVGGVVDTAFRAGAITLQALSANEQLSAQRTQTYADLTLQKLQDQADVGSEITDAQLADLQAAIDQSTSASAAQVAELNRALELGKEQRAAELAFARDLAELNDKRLAHFALVQQMPRYSLEVDQAALAIQQRVLEYRLTVQDAQLAEARRALLQAQYSDANSLLGSPAVVFSRVNRLDRADLYLQEARERMMDWLTSLEYLAVRPFVDHRMRILLARNPLQLERIALSLDAVQNTCGGNTSKASLEVSVRDDLLGINQPLTDVDGSVVTPGGRFRSLLQRGSVPIDRRVRYSTDQTVGGLLSRNSGVLAASFTLSLENFGNLALACNAKMIGFDLSLVGDIGAGLPVVTVLYDGTSHVRSCQPDITSYVASIGGSKWTNFGAVTLFHATGRSASPNAGINGFLPGNNPNVTLDGLPLASEYTVLIDTTVGDNAKLDWSKLEDLKLRINYGYQDLFAAGQCHE